MKIKIFALVALASTLLSAPVSAALYQLNATPIIFDPEFPNPVSGFSILFNDTGGGILEFDKVVPNGFSGFTFIPDGTIYNILLHIPDISGISASSQDPLDLFPYGSTDWVFSNASAIPLTSPTVPPEFDFWTYDIAIVPLPGALPLFASALGVMGLLGWRRKRKHAAAAAAA